VTRFAEVAATSAAVGATRSRTAKVAALAELLGRLGPDEVVPVVAMLSGTVRQGRIGVGWATVAKLDVSPLEGDPVLEIVEVDAALDALAGASGPGSVGARHAVLVELLERATAPEVDLLRRLLTGELRQGALESLVVDAVARASDVPAAVVRRAAMLAGDVPAVAAVALHGGGRRQLDALGLRVGTAIQPMLAASAESVADALERTGEASVEWKLDGARIQAHRDGDDVRLFTRNLNDVTDRLPGIVELVRSFPARSLVLDGEAMSWDPVTKGPPDEVRTGRATAREPDGDGARAPASGGAAPRPALFQDTMSSFGRQRGDAGARLRAGFFDVLHVDGEDLLDRPLVERLEVLDRVVGPAAIPRLVTADAAAAEAFAADALARGHEGVMVKALGSTYDAGRRGGSWRKVKPVRTLDLVVLAVEWGSGRRQGWLSNLHLGARAEGPPAEFVMVGKTFKGMTDELLAWQTEQLLAREVAREGHVVHVRPELVVEIALDGVQRSTRYPGGVALRFARVRRYRDDKDAADADTITTVQALLR
jgi:DNA ligase 1